MLTDDCSDDYDYCDDDDDDDCAYDLCSSPSREHSPSIIFMDEIDSIGSTRIDSGGSGGIQ